MTHRRQTESGARSPSTLSRAVRGGDVSPCSGCEHALSDWEARARAVLETVSDAVLIIDERGVIETCNPATLGLFGYSHEELTGRRIDLLMASAGQGEPGERIARFLGIGGVGGVGAGREMDARRKDGTVFRAEVSVTEFGVAGGRRFTGVVRDVSERHEALERLRRSEERLQRSQRFARIGNWEWNVRTGEVYGSALTWAMFGHEAVEREGTREDFLHAVHPGDRERIEEAAEACLEDGVDYEVEHRVVWPDGTVRWLLEQGDVVRDRDGLPLRMLGVVQDVTQRHEDREQLASFRRIIDASNQAIGVADPEGRLLYVNPAHQELFEGRLEDFVGRHVRSFVPPEAAEEAEVLRTIFETAGGWHGLLPVRTCTGRVFVVHSTIDVVLDERGDVQFVFNIMRDVSRELERQRELEVAREQAEAANRAKSDFLSGMSHELRTPLSGILGFAKLLETSRDDPLSDRQREYVHHIIQSGRHLLALVDDVLDLAAVERGNVPLEVEDVSVRDLVDEAVDTAGVLAAPYGVSVVDQTGPEVPKVRADATRLRQVLLNLLSNAIKYNRQGGEVRLLAEEHEPGRLRLAIEDTGIGIPASRHADVFRPFRRLGAEGSDVEGTGIGLAMCRRLVLAMKGRIGFTSEPERGSAFWIDLERAGDGGDAAPSPEPPSCASEPLVTGGCRTVLYVEDDPANLRLMEAIIEESSDLRLVTTHTAEFGLRLAFEGRPDVIMLDINLPGMDGFEALERLRRHPATRGTPVIALSADALPEAAARGREAGFAAYLTKPVAMDDIVEGLRAALTSDAGDPDEARESR
ncbi:MAG: PAS domain S-box protein [Myxococcota bacterium]